MAEKTVKVERHTYTRTIKPRPVTFTCECHPGGPSTITEDRGPGPVPTVCSRCHADGTYKAWRAAVNLKKYHENKIQPTP